MPAVTSSAIVSICHEPATKRLFVTFVSGATYRYDGVSARVYDRFLASESKGAFFSQSIRELYPTRRVASPEAWPERSGLDRH